MIFHSISFFDLQELVYYSKEAQTDASSFHIFEEDQEQDEEKKDLAKTPEQPLPKTELTVEDKQIEEENPSPESPHPVTGKFFFFL